MFGQWCCVPEPPCAGALGEAGVVVDGLELAGGEGLGLAASTGPENAMMAPIAAPPTTGAPRSSSLRLSGIFASCNGFALRSRGLVGTTLRRAAQEAVGESLEFDWKW